jgi:hypothetical protein
MNCCNEYGECKQGHGCPAREKPACAEIERLTKVDCQHRIADARNPIVHSGYVCVDCGALFAAADHTPTKVDVAPVAWEHGCNALLQNIELWVDRCPHCGKPRSLGTASALAAAQAEVERLREVALSARNAMESCTPGDYSTGHVIHPYFDEAAVNDALDAIDAALQGGNT